MTIAEAIIAKHKAEQSILEILKQFTQLTGLTIKNIDLDTVGFILGPDEPTKVTITIVL